MRGIVIMLGSNLEGEIEIRPKRQLKKGKVFHIEEGMPKMQRPEATKFVWQK